MKMGKKNYDTMERKNDLNVSTKENKSAYKSKQNNLYNENKIKWETDYKHNRPKKRIKPIIITMLILLILVGILIIVYVVGHQVSKLNEPLVVTKVEDLLQMETDNRDIELGADLDFEYQTINPINCKNFNGNGYVIKNVVISQNNVRGTVSLFDTVSSINNLYLDNINVVATSSFGAAILCQVNCQSINNVHITNSKVSTSMPYYGSGLGASYRDVYLGGIYSGGFVDNKEEINSNCNITNCSVTNSTLEIVKEEETSANVTDLVIGGIAGTANNISNCYTSNLKIICETSGMYNKPIIGGVVGYLAGELNNTYAINNSFDVDSNYYQDTIIGVSSSASATVGGLIGNAKGNSTIRYCFSQENILDVSCRGNINAGGLIGYSIQSNISNSYSYNNEITMTNYLIDSLDDVTRCLGGFVGLSKNDVISSSFAYHSSKLEETTITDDNDSIIGGFAGEIDGSDISCLAAYMNNAICNKPYAFAYGNYESNNCYVNNNGYINNTSCEIVDDSFFINSSLMESSLELIGPYWNFEPGKIPYLKF